MRQTRIGTALAAFLLAGAASADTIVINFDFYPGPDGVLGTGDDIAITAPTTFSAQPLQLTNQFASVGILFTPDPPTNDKNEILDNNSFTTPAGSTEPNLFAASGTLAIEGSFTVPVFEVGAIIGISGGTDRLEIFDAGGSSLGSIVGDDVFVSLSSTTPIARFVIVAATSTTAAIDNLTFVTGTTTPTCYANCDGSTAAPILNVQDFSCFLNAFASGDSYANCDGSTSAPVLNVQDFSCFLNAFAAGCT